MARDLPGVSVIGELQEYFLSDGEVPFLLLWKSLLRACPSGDLCCRL